MKQGRQIILGTMPCESTSPSIRSIRYPFYPFSETSSAQPYYSYPTDVACRYVDGVLTYEISPCTSTLPRGLSEQSFVARKRSRERRRCLQIVRRSRMALLGQAPSSNLFDIRTRLMGPKENRILKEDPLRLHVPMSSPDDVTGRRPSPATLQSSRRGQSHAGRVYAEDIPPRRSRGS